MRHSFLLLSCLIGLGACAYTLDSTVQELRVETPGAEQARCFVYVEGLRFSFRPPETQTIPKSREDLLIDCQAPGNRRRKVMIEAQGSESFVYNALFPPAVIFDYVSDASHGYPELIIVDFTNAPLLPESLPAQNNPDIRSPESYQLEEFKAGKPRLNEDFNRQPVEIKRRQRNIVPPPAYFGQEPMQTGTQNKEAGSEGTAAGASISSDIQPVINPAGQPDRALNE